MVFRALPSLLLLLPQFAVRPCAAASTDATVTLTTILTASSVAVGIIPTQTAHGLTGQIVKRTDSNGNTYFDIDETFNVVIQEIRKQYPDGATRQTVMQEAITNANRGVSMRKRSEGKDIAMNAIDVSLNTYYLSHWLDDSAIPPPEWGFEKPVYAEMGQRPDDLIIVTKVSDPAYTIGVDYSLDLPDPTWTDPPTEISSPACPEPIACDQAECNGYFPVNLCTAKGRVQGCPCVPVIGGFDFTVTVYTADLAGAFSLFESISSLPKTTAKPFTSKKPVQTTTRVLPPATQSSFPVQCNNKKCTWTPQAKNVQNCLDAMANQGVSSTRNAQSSNITQVYNGDDKVLVMNIGWIPGCDLVKSEVADNPLGKSGDNTVSYSKIIADTYTQCPQGGGYSDVGCLRYGFYPTNIQAVFASPPKPQLMWAKYPNIC
ncbi:hypothetical protein MMC21_007647 [Puttea exsequens]|nr:hypothetical protein [Puttea exsequens]